MLGFLGSIVTWLGTPGNPVLPALGLAGLWVWHKVRGEKTDSWQDIVKGMAGSLAQEAITAWVPGGTLADGLAYVRDYIEARAWKVLSKRGVPRNSLTESLVHGAIETATSDLGNLIATKLLAAQMNALGDRANKVASTAFQVDPNSALAQVGRDIGAMVERVQ